MRYVLTLMALLFGVGNAHAATCAFGNTVFMDGAGSELRFSGEWTSNFDARMTVGKIQLTGHVIWSNGAMRPYIDLGIPNQEEPIYGAEIYALTAVDGHADIREVPGPKDPTVPTLLLPNFSATFYNHLREKADKWPGDVFRFSRCETPTSAETNKVE